MLYLQHPKFEGGSLGNVSPLLLKGTRYLFPLYPACTTVSEETRHRMVFEGYASVLGWVRQALYSYIITPERAEAVCFPVGRVR